MTSDADDTCSTGHRYCAPPPDGDPRAELAALRVQLDALGAEMRARLDAVEAAIAGLQSRPA